jgi:hypothetical protein
LAPGDIQEYAAEEAAFGRIIIDDRGLSAGMRLHLTEPVRTLFGHWREARTPFDQLLIPHIKDIEAIDRLDLIRALASDEARFSQSKITIRAVVYSDMAENSDLGSVFKPLAEQNVNYGKKLGTYLRRSVFYGFGLGETVNAAAIADDARKFWSAALASMNASIGGLGADLNVPNVVPVHGYAFAVNLARDGQEFDGRLDIIVDAEGTLTDSWIGISRLTIAAVSGTFLCQGGAEDGTCHLEGTTNSGIATLTPSEAIALTGNQESGMNGHLGVKGAMFPLTARTARN